jgi:filamentous hemagglutinin family protein
MHQDWLLGIAIISTMIFSANRTQAQITPDTTLPHNSNVNLEDNIFNITGGTSAGSNLFHSFNNFSVPTGSTAFFQNSPNIQNILTRVTGGSISDIDGLIKANGTANLFLINPNGIVFGQNARLDVGGSFVASTASSLKFKDGYEFSATNPESAPLLTITAPVGLDMDNNPGEIKVTGTGHNIPLELITKEPRNAVDDSSVTGLEVQEGKTLALLGGKVSFEGGILKAPQGRIEIGSVGGSGSVNLVPVPEGWKLNYQDITNFENIQFSGKPLVNTTGKGGGSIVLVGRDITLTQESLLLGDTVGAGKGGGTTIIGDSISLNQSNISNYTFDSGEAGLIQLFANRYILLENQSSPRNHTTGIGKGGEIALEADSIIFKNQSGLGSNTYSEGNAGRINLRANSLLIEQGSGMATLSEEKGNAGEININVKDSFVIRKKSGLASNTSDTGNAGKISITANSLLLEEQAGIESIAKQGSMGDGGEIDIKTDSLTVKKSSSINTNSRGRGNAGKISITANSLLVQDFAEISSKTTGQSSKGNGGEIKIDTGSLTVQKYAGIKTNSSNTGNAGQVNVTAQSLLIQDFAEISSNTEQSSTGSAGNVTVNANSIVLHNDGALRVMSTGTGNAGILQITADNILLRNNSKISATAGTAQAGGDGGTINITANSLLIETRSGVNTGTHPRSSGNGGAIDINVKDFVIRKQSGVVSNTSGTGNAGKINITANSLLLEELVGISSNTSEPSSKGNGGEIKIDTGSLTIQNYAGIKTNSSNAGNAGQINVTAQSLLIQDFAEIGSNTEQDSTGSAGNVTVNADSIVLRNDGALRVISTGTGNAGILKITADKIRLDNKGLISASTTSGNGGDITIKETDLLLLRHNSQISATAGTAEAGGDGGNIDIDAKFIIAVPKENSDISANAYEGIGGNINITTQGLFGIGFRPQPTPHSDITVSSQFGINGNVNINTPDVDPSQGLVELASELGVPEPIQGCQASYQKSTSRFINTGRGGLPPNPYEALDNNEVWKDVQLPRQLADNSVDVRGSSKSIVEAQGWMINKNGNLELVAQIPNTTSENLCSWR